MGEPGVPGQKGVPGSPVKTSRLWSYLLISRIFYFRALQVKREPPVLLEKMEYQVLEAYLEKMYDYKYCSLS